MSIKISIKAIVSISVLVFSGAISAETVADYLHDAKEYYQKGEIKAAVIQLKNALKESPNNGEARLLLG